MSENKRISKASPLQEVRTKPSKSVDSNKIRICQHKKCKIRLSRYNFADYCVLHERYHSDSKNFI